jgi:hypothetical protein
MTVTTLKPKLLPRQIVDLATASSATLTAEIAARMLALGESAYSIGEFRQYAEYLRFDELCSTARGYGLILLGRQRPFTSERRKRP